jgi:hypothetical protein
MTSEPGERNRDIAADVVKELAWDTVTGGSSVSVTRRRRRNALG